jgi:membrane carboxypeptidase/penicillin-binding protein PbpC
MRWTLRLAATLGLLVLGLAVYFVWTVSSAKKQTPALVAAALADAASRESSLTVEDLGKERESLLLAIEDPMFRKHHGVDFATPGAGWTTITQGLVKLLYFPEGFKAGFAKIRQTLIAQYALDAQVSKDQQLTLYLNITYFGNVDGRAVRGFSDAARTYFHKEFAALTRREFISLVAMTIGPNDLKPGSQANDERIERIEGYLSGAYVPKDVMDVEYKGRVPDDGVAGRALLGFLKLVTKDRPEEW